MTHNQFEKQIADKLNRHEVQPGEGMLDSIFEKRAARKKPSFGLTRLFIAATLVTVTIAILYMYDGKGDGQAIANQDAPAMLDRQPESNVTTLDKANARSGNEVAAANTSVSEKKAPSKTPARGQKQRQPVVKNAAYADATPSNTDREIPSNTRVVISNNNNNNDYSDNGENITQRYFDINAKNRPSIASAEHKGNSHLYVYHSVNESVLDANTSFSMSLRPLNKFASVYELENEKTAASHKAEVASRGKTGSRPFFIDMLYVPVYTSSAAVGKGETQGYMNSIKTSSFNNQYGVRVSVPVSGRLSVFSGLFYQEQGNVYNGSITRAEQVTKVNTIVTYINDPVKGPIKVTSYQTVTAMEDKQRDYNFKNTYKMFQLPLGLSYNFGYKKLDFALNTSALMNMYTNSNGKCLVVENNGTSAFSSSGKYFGVGAGFSVMSALRISPKFRLIFEPGIQYFRIGSSKAGNNINERVINSQFAIGLRYSVF